MNLMSNYLISILEKKYVYFLFWLIYYFSHRNAQRVSSLNWNIKMTKNKTLSYAFGSTICQDSMSLEMVISRIPFVDSILDIAIEMQSHTVCKWYSESKEIGNDELTDGLRRIWYKHILS